MFNKCWSAGKDDIYNNNNDLINYKLLETFGYIYDNKDLTIEVHI